MRNQITYEELRKLGQMDREACVSLYLPTHRAIPETRQDRIRFKNLIRQAADLLADRGLRRQDVEQILKPAQDHLDDDSFWAHQADGLAVFLSDGFADEYQLPLTFTERVDVGSTFHLTQLIPAVHGNGAFYILAVSPKTCRLMRADRDECIEMQLDELPEDLRSALGWWRERALNFHSHSAGAGDDTAMFHGHETDKEKIDIGAYFRRIVKAIAPVIDESRAPIVYAGDEQWFPLFRDAARSLRLIREPLTGNPDRKSAQDLHRDAWNLVESQFKTSADEIIDRFHELEQQSHGTSSMAEILPASRDGLVATLIVSEDAEHFGNFSDETMEITPEGTVQDLVNRAIVQTLRTGGDVITVPADKLPGGVHVAANLRSPVDAIATSST